MPSFLVDLLLIFGRSCKSLVLPHWSGKDMLGIRLIWGDGTEGCILILEEIMDVSSRLKFVSERNFAFTLLGTITYPTYERGKSSSQLPLNGYVIVPWRVDL